MPASETVRMQDQLRRVYEGPAWLGPSLKELLDGVDQERAARRPLPEAHSIWELVLHITAWLRIARERLFATAVRDHTEEENWAPITGLWQDALIALDREVRALEQALTAVAPERLDQAAPASEPQTFYILMHGVIQHTAYHAGQIALLRK